MIRLPRVSSYLPVAALLTTFGCDRGAPSGPEGAASTASATSGAEDAKQVFAQRCVACHGQSGKGDGPGAASLDPKPRDYTSAQWQASVTDDDLRKVIVKGGAAVGKSNLMPPSPDLESRPEVVSGLVRIVRGFAK
ncbi:MAG: c-type cytochrome [Deltaproteobacteria bacterium]|nr:c-type cytochrome [Deltaproteobacteria bacterium]